MLTNHQLTVSGLLANNYQLTGVGQQLLLTDTCQLVIKFLITLRYF